MSKTLALDENVVLLSGLGQQLGTVADLLVLVGGCATRLLVGGVREKKHPSGVRRRLG